MEGIELVSSWGQRLLGSVALVVLTVSILRDLQVVAIVALATFALAALPQVLEDLVSRLEKLGPATFRASPQGRIKPAKRIRKGQIN
jgi:hypothetical protein